MALMTFDAPLRYSAPSLVSCCSPQNYGPPHLLREAVFTAIDCCGWSYGTVMVWLVVPDVPDVSVAVSVTV